MNPFVPNTSFLYPLKTPESFVAKQLWRIQLFKETNKRFLTPLQVKSVPWLKWSIISFDSSIFVMESCSFQVLKKYFHASRSRYNPEIRNQVSSANRFNSHAKHLEGQFSLQYHYREHQYFQIKDAANDITSQVFDR